MPRQTHRKTRRPERKESVSLPLKRKAIQFLDGRSGRMTEIARAIWRTPEVGLEEFRSSALLVKELEEAGFEVETGVAGMPTAFAARWGRGRPTVALLAEYDAVPNCDRTGTRAAHGCGHNLFGTASVSAGIAVKEALREGGAKGTVKVFGTPAEEMLYGKVVMAKAGVFDGLDAALSWHPGEGTHADYGRFMSLDSVTFEFFGKASHAQVDPEKGRNALEAAEWMIEGVNGLRGRIPAGTGINHAITEGGDNPIVVLPYAKVWYMIWTPARDQTEAATAEVKKVARSAARATGTRVRIRHVTGTYHRLTIAALGELIDRNLRWVKAPRFSAQDKALARRLGFRKPLVERVEPPLREDHLTPVSNDQCNLSWLAPFGFLRTTCRAPDTPQHHWLSTVQYDSGIGWKGMLTASKALAATALDLLTQPAALAAVRKEFREKTRGFTYRSPI